MSNNWLALVADWTKFTPSSHCVQVTGLNMTNLRAITFMVNATPPQDVMVTFDATGCPTNSPTTFTYQILFGGSSNLYMAIRYDPVLSYAIRDSD